MNEVVTNPEVVTSIWTTIMTIIPIVVTAAAAIAAVFPASGDNSVWAAIRKVIDLLALNFGNAKNAK